MKNYLTSKSFIIDFLKVIEQPLSDYEVKKIKDAEKYLDELLEQQRKAIDEMLNEEF